MEFDKTKVYSAVNADEVKIGSKGFVANNINSLKAEVMLGTNVKEVLSISDENAADRFNMVGTFSYPLFYLVKEPEENKLCPFKDTTELFTEWAKHANKLPIAPIDMPAVYLKPKDSDLSQLIEAYDTRTVIVGARSFDMKELCDNWTFNDGSPCGVEED